ncbi:MAG: hypothetical protein J0J14_12915 [Hyphomicrobium sp.]|nr:hypothetical protein [Hyphomicrobium sp.]
MLKPSQPRPSKRWLPRLSLHVLLVALVTGGIVHITSTLAIPYMGASTAFDRVSAGLTLNAMRVLPPAAPGSELLPFSDPVHQLAICPFDLNDGLLTVTATLPDPGWSLAIYTQHGDNFYAVAAAGLRQPDVTLVLEPSRATLLNLFGIGTAPNFDPSRIQAPEHRGLVVVRAPRHGRAFEERTAAMLARARCTSGPASG